ncbi:MAG TPA: response regulator [Chthoniobacteraceae bacterium]|nr:response regulator [Chthoniobacteraceae bacterium]
MPSDLICLLDDEPSILKALGRLLASEGLVAEKFTEPARFLDYARTHPVRLAVIDIRMPGMSGLDVLAALRTIAPSTEAIIITAEDDPAHRVQARAAGACAFFLKPLDDDAFLTAVKRALSLHAGSARP